MARETRRLWVWPLLVVLLWLLVGGPLGSFAGRLAEVQENDNAAFLPQSAESTKVLDEFLQFTGKESLPATVVFEREDGLTSADKETITGLVDDLAGVTYVDGAAITGPITKPFTPNTAMPPRVEISTT